MSTVKMLSEKVETLETENAILKNMLKKATHATFRFVEMLTQMDQLLIKRKEKIDNLTKSLELQTANFEKLETGNTLANQNASYRYVEMLSQMDELLTKRKNEIDNLTKSLENKNTDLDKMKNESIENLSMDDYYELREKRLRQTENIKKQITKDGLYQCRICEYSTKHWWSLEKHIRVHTGEKPFKCDHSDCPQRFSDQSTLIRHKRTHNNDRPFSCTICERKFSQSNSLKLHCKSLHDGKGFSLKRYQPDFPETKTEPIENVEKVSNNQEVLSPMDRLQIIASWENQTKNSPITKRSIARTFGVDDSTIRRTIKRKDYWKEFFRLDANSPVPTDFLETKTEPIENIENVSNNQQVLSPMDRLQIISSWENQTKNSPITKASIARTFCVDASTIRRTLKKKNYWKEFAGLDINSPVPTTIFTGKGLKMLQTTLNAPVLPRDEGIIEQSNTIPDFELTL